MNQLKLPAYRGILNQEDRMVQSSPQILAAKRKYRYSSQLSLTILCSFLDSTHRKNSIKNNQKTTFYLHDTFLQLQQPEEELLIQQLST